MLANQTVLKPHQPACYLICVQGVLDEDWSDYFGGRLMSCKQTTNSGATTMLSATVVDQAMLLGMLNYLNGLGLSLLHVEWLVDDAPGSAYHALPDQERVGQ